MQQNLAELSLDPATNKWIATFQGMKIASSPNRKYICDTIERGLNQKAKSLGIVGVRELHSGNVGEVLQANGFQMPIRPEFTIQERFDFLQNLVEMIIDGTANAVLVTGDGGLGKSFTVTNTMKKANLTFTSDFEPPEEQEVEDDDEEEEVEPWENPGNVHLIKGYSSAKGLYRALWENNGKIIVMDDCDSVQKDANAINILKGALDTADERIVSWNAELGRGAVHLPKNFKFTGRIIFISNLSMVRIDESLKTRCMRVDLSMSPSEKIERMRYIIDQETFLPEIDHEVKEDALSFLNEHMDLATNLSIRSLLDAIKFRNSGKHNWERQALYSLTA